MASRTDKPVQEEDEVQREEVDPAKTTEEEVNEEAIESSLNQNRQENARITIRTSGEAIERGSTSFADDQNMYSPCPFLSAIQYDQEEDCGLLGFPSTHERPVAPVQTSQAMLPSEVNFVTQPQYQRMNQPERVTTSSASEHNRGLVPQPPYQNLSNQTINQQERLVASVQNESNQPFVGTQRGKRRVCELGESSSSRKRQNVAPRGPMTTYNQQHGFSSSQNNLRHPFGMRQQPLWQTQAPGFSEGYQEYLERLGRSSVGSAVNQRQHYSSSHAPPRPELNPNMFPSHGFSAVQSFHQGRDHRPSGLVKYLAQQNYINPVHYDMYGSYGTAPQTQSRGLTIGQSGRGQHIQLQFNQGGMGQNQHLQQPLHQGGRGVGLNLQQQLHQGVRRIGLNLQHQLHHGGGGRGENVHPQLQRGERDAYQNLQQQLRDGYQNLQQQLELVGRDGYQNLQHQLQQGGRGIGLNLQHQLHQGGGGQGENVQPQLQQGERDAYQNLQQQLQQGGRGIGLNQHQQFHQGGRGQDENVQPQLQQGERGRDQNLQQQFHQGGGGGGL